MENAEAQLFRDEAFLARHPLNVHNVLDYFYSSQFYDPNCINQKRRKGQPCGPKEPGVEYILLRQPNWPDIAKAQPNQFGVFVIQKIRREVNETETPLECYYVIGGSLLKAPSLNALICHRLITAFNHIGELIDLVDNLSGWTVLDGFCWSSSNKSTDTSETSAAADKLAPCSPNGSTSPATQNKGTDNELSGPATMVDDSPPPAVTLSNDVSPAQSAAKRPAGAAPLKPVELFYKRRCTEIDLVLCRAFEEVADNCLKFNAKVAKVKQRWATEDELWQQKEWASVRERIDKEMRNGDRGDPSSGSNAAAMTP